LREDKRIKLKIKPLWRRRSARRSGLLFLDHKKEELPTPIYSLKKDQIISANARIGGYKDTFNLYKTLLFALLFLKKSIGEVV